MCNRQASSQSPVYYMLVNVWRSGSEKLPDAIRSYKTHVATRKAKPDWEGFVIGIFGLDAVMPLLNKKSSAAETAAEAATKAEAPASAEADQADDSCFMGLKRRRRILHAQLKPIALRTAMTHLQ